MTIERSLSVLALLLASVAQTACVAWADESVPKAVSAGDYLRPAVRFLKFLPQAMEVAKADPTLEYYGTGGSGHWPVQSSLMVMSGLAILSTVPDAELKAAGSPFRAVELRDRALRMLRYAFRIHKTGDLVATDGQQWGEGWISVLGTERSAEAMRILEPYLTETERARFKRLLVQECDYRLRDYPIEAGLFWQKNKPESNIWNAGILFRTAALYPDLPNAKAYVEKARRMMLNALTSPSDVKEPWFVGANFTDNWALDHHGYLNVGYMNASIANLATLHFWYKGRGEESPNELRHHVADLWKVCKKLTFPDGRLCRIGSDTRVRWTYCQLFAIQTWLLVQDLLGDAEAAGFESRYLKRILEEQVTNDDGSFFGRRLAEMRGSSWYYYTRLESDAFYTMTLAYWWHRHYAFPAPKAVEIPADGETWEEPCQRALFLKTPKSVRSVVFRAQGAVSQLDYAPNILCVPTDTSDLADWGGNLVGRVGVNRESDWWSGAPDIWPTNGLVRTFTQDDFGRGFRMDFICDVNEQALMGEGEKTRNVATRRMQVEALSDGATLAIHERVTMNASETLPRGFHALHLMIPNDVHNGFVRTFRGGSFAATYDRPPAADETIETGSRVLTVDDKLSVFAVKGRDLRIRRTARPATVFRNARYLRDFPTERAEEVVMDADFGPHRARYGETLYDVVYLVSTCDGATAARMAASVRWDEESGTLTLTAADGRARTVSFDAAPSVPEVVRRISEQFLSTEPEAYRPRGFFGINGYPERSALGKFVHYSTVILWANALDCARLAGDTDLERRLVERFAPFYGAKSELLPKFKHVDFSVFGAVPLGIAALTNDARAQALGLRFADGQFEKPKADDPPPTYNAKTLEERMDWWAKGYSDQTRLWIDDGYMICLLQTQAFRATGDRKYLDRAARELVLYLDRLQLENGLFHHADGVPICWGRGNGWMVGAMALMLRHLPEGHPDRARILSGFRRMCETLRRHQRTDGRWGQIVDDAGSWPETSCSAMFASGFALGAKRGWLDADYLDAAKRTWTTLVGLMDTFGNFPETCCGTSARDSRDHYLHRVRINGDPHGQAAMLWLAGALLEGKSAKID